MSGYFDFEAADNDVAHPPRTHYHSDYEVYFLTEGRCRYFIDQKTYRLSPGDIVVIPPGIIHKVIYETDRHSRMLFNCTEDFIPPSVLKIIDRLSFFPQTPDTAKQVSLIYKNLRQASTRPDPFWEDTLRCCAMQLFLLMGKTADSIQALPVGSAFVENAVAYIRANYMYKLTLPETARHCAVSPEHLSRTFKRETGFGFNEYLTLYRMKKGESLLKSGTAKSVAQVASLCGFSDSNYFSNTYKKLYGISPSQVRKQADKEAGYV